MYKTPKKLIVFFGPPGSGKGTQADMLGEKLSIPVISPGELLRHERDEGTEIGKIVEDKMSKGVLVSDELVEKIIDKRLARPDTKNGFILDGYPRREEQLVFFADRIEKAIGEDKKVLAIYIEAKDEEIERRISGRRVCDCGASYHVISNPPKKESICDLCGEKLYQRKDDRPEILKERLKGFHIRIKPLLGYFEKDHELVRVDGSQSIESLRKLIWALVEEKF